MAAAPTTSPGGGSSCTRQPDGALAAFLPLPLLCMFCLCALPPPRPLYHSTVVLFDHSYKMQLVVSNSNKATLKTRGKQGCCQRAHRAHGCHSWVHHSTAMERTGALQTAARTTVARGRLEAATLLPCSAARRCCLSWPTIPAGATAAADALLRRGLAPGCCSDAEVVAAPAGFTTPALPIMTSWLVSPERAPQASIAFTTSYPLMTCPKQS